MAESQVKRLTLDLLKRHRGRLIVLLVLTIIAFMSMSVSYWFFGEAISDIKQHLDVPKDEFMDVVVFWAVLIMCFSIGRGVFLFITAFLRITAIQTILHYLRETLFDRVQEMELDWHHKHGAGELVTRTTRDCDMVRNATDSGFQLVEIGTMLCGSLILLYTYHWQLFIIPFILVVIAMFLYYRQAKVMVHLNRATDDAYDHVTQDLTEGIAGVRVVKAFGLEAQRSERFSGHVNEFIMHGLRAVKYAVTRIPLPQLMVAMAHPWLLVWGILLIEAGVRCHATGDIFDVGHLLACLMAVTTLIFRLDGMGSAMRMIAEAIASMQRLSEVIYSEPKLNSGDQLIAEGAIHIDVNDIQVQDDKGHWILRGCTFDIKPGEIVALIGSTGSGKSTLCSLIPRLKDAYAGSVTFRDEQGGETEVRNCDLSKLRRRVQVVPQESFLFSDTIAGNMRMGKQDASDDEIWQALIDAGIDEFVRGLDDQLDTQVGERGMNLSGGQKQRLCLARALVSKPDVLILDDSTSALDAITEEHIFKLMREQKSGSSVLLVTTRLSSVLLADRVLLLGDGQIIANDTHQHLAEHNDRYRGLLCLDQEGSV